MAFQARNNPQSRHDGESYFVSMMDMLVGMLFLFIIMLMFFAMKFNEAAIKKIDTFQTLISAEETRSKILEDIRKAMMDQGVVVEIDLENGILRLPEKILFDRNKSILSLGGRDAVATLSKSLFLVLPCYATSSQRKNGCGKIRHQVESVFIEGHTDSDGDDTLNWNLSFQRSLVTYQFMIGTNPELAALRNHSGQAIISLSGYGKQRPVKANDTDDNKRQNRRIDVRFIMSTPKIVDLREDSLAIQGKIK
ncbi:hypothetical protein CCP4SC76_380003 [Gammaproteobacteria bacterium]